jgi:hypothetical protein
MEVNFKCYINNHRKSAQVKIKFKPNIYKDKWQETIKFQKNAKSGGRCVGIYYSG